MLNSNKTVVTSSTTEVEEVALPETVDVARVDRVFLFLMPTAFVIYNIVYWSVVITS